MADHICMSDARTIRAATALDAEAIESTAVAAEMFSEPEAGFLGEMLRAACDGDCPGAHWLVLEDDAGAVVGAAYYAPEPFADRMWNLYFIAVVPAHQGRGAGTQLMGHVEATLRSMGAEEARTLVVETSSTPKYARTRDFYDKLGYDREARIRQFYGPQDDKIVFWKSLTA